MLYATVAAETGISPDALLDAEPLMFHAILEALKNKTKRQQ